MNNDIYKHIHDAENLHKELLDNKQFFKSNYYGLEVYR